MLAQDQDGLLVATLALLEGAGQGPLERHISEGLGSEGSEGSAAAPAWVRWCGGELVADAERFARAAFSSGLSASLASLAARRGVPLPPAWRGYAEEQVEAVAARQARYRALLPEVLAALADAGVAALPVKGLVVADAVWPDPSWRPMSDLDVVVAPEHRREAGDALVRLGLQHWASAAWEDTFLAWGDGTIGRVDGESPDHNGKVEVHPGWVERLHHYLVSDHGLLLGNARPGEVAGAPALTLDAAGRALQVVGHLSACVVRGEVRPLNVVDAVLCLQALDGHPDAPGDGWERFATLACALDERLVHPGLWLVRHYRPWLGGGTVTGRSPGALGSAGARRQLSAAPRWAVLRDPAQRRGLGWRLSFASAPAERLAVLRQWVLPPSSDGGVAAGRAVWRVEAERVGRAGRIAARRVPWRTPGRGARP